MRKRLIDERYDDNYEDFDDIHDDYEIDDNSFDEDMLDDSYDEDYDDSYDDDNDVEEWDEDAEDSDDEVIDEEEINKFVKELSTDEVMIEDFDNNEEIFRYIKNNPDMLQEKKDELLNKVAEDNYKTIYYIANKCATYSATIDDLVEAGQVGYAKAIHSYDPDRGTKFSTFAINCIRNEIYFHLRKVKKHYYNDISTEATRHKDKNGNDLRLEDILADNRDTPEEASRNEAIRKAIDEALKYLTPKERHVMIYRYALQGEKEKTQNEIADLLGMSQANISKIEKNCLERLKELLIFKI